MAINPPQNIPSPWTHLFHRSCHFLKQFWKSSFMSVFSCAVVGASMSLIDSKRLRFMVILTLGKSQSRTVPDPVNKVEEDKP